MGPGGLNEFVKQGRALILYDKAAIYPGLAADVVISVSLTTSAIAAVLGRSVIYCNMHVTAKDNLSQIPNARVISRVEELKDAICAAVEEASARGYPEKLEPVKGSSIDPFVDGCFGERVSGYMKDLLAELKEKKSDGIAISSANEKYKERWGGETVIKAPER